jgi:tetratricopeptide (TPR) repeat protein
MNCASEIAGSISQLADRFVFERQCAPMVEAAAQEAIRLDAKCALAYYALAIVKARQESTLAEALEDARRAVAIEPESALYVYRLGLILSDRLKDTNTAEPAFRRAVELEPDNPYYYIGLIQLLLVTNRSAEAAPLVDTVRPLLESDANWYGLAALESVSGNLEAAWRNFSRAAAQTDFNLEWSLADPDLAPLRNTAQFEAWLEQLRGLQGHARTSTTTQ